jgi:hypothetical protein
MLGGRRVRSSQWTLGPGPLAPPYRPRIAEAGSLVAAGGRAAGAYWTAERDSDQGWGRGRAGGRGRGGPGPGSKTGPGLRPPGLDGHVPGLARVASDRLVRAGSAGLETPSLPAPGVKFSLSIATNRVTCSVAAPSSLISVLVRIFSSCKLRLYTQSGIPVVVVWASLFLVN